MLDPCDKGSETEDMSRKSPDQFMKTCADCGTSKTPLWRGGPAGPKSLCNACGIRSRKKKRDVLSLDKEKKPRKGHSGNNTSSSGNSSCSNSKLGDGLKQRLMAIGRDVMMRKRSKIERQRRKLGEEEQAAVLLMALSYGSVYA